MLEKEVRMIEDREEDRASRGAARMREAALRLSRSSALLQLVAPLVDTAPPQARHRLKKKSASGELNPS